MSWLKIWKFSQPGQSKKDELNQKNLKEELFRKELEHKEKSKKDKKTLRNEGKFHFCFKKNMK